MHQKIWGKIARIFQNKEPHSLITTKNGKLMTKSIHTCGELSPKIYTVERKIQVM